MFLPYKVDVPLDHRPVINWLIFCGAILAFIWQIFTPIEQVKALFLDGWGIGGLFGHMWLHGGIGHIVGNMIFLWLFGNAVCSKIGNIVYLPVYLSLGLLAAISHLIFRGGPMIGASGAINGIVGMYLVFFPKNSISCFMMLIFQPIFFSISGFWLILMWFVFDIWGATKGGAGVAYFAHLGGFAGGFVLAVAMLRWKFVVMERYEESILQVFKRGKKITEEGVTSDFDVRVQLWNQQVRQASNNELHFEENVNDFIRFYCSCGKRIKVPAKYSGKSGRCPKCSRRVQIPQE